MKQLKRDCKPEDANDRSLPSNSYLISYNDGTKIAHDIVMSSKQADIFDYYYDNFYSDEIVDQKNLMIPHPRLHLRNFVLYPLNDIASDFVHPILIKPINELLEECKDNDTPIESSLSLY